MRQPHAHQDSTVVITTKYDVDGYPETQVAPIGPGSSSTPAEARWPYGFIGRANDADQDSQGNVTNGAFARTQKEGSTLSSWTEDDPRVTSLLPQIGKGGSQTYGAQPNDASTLSFAQHDGQGNYEIKAPGAKKITIHLDGGPPIVFEGSLVKVGDTPVVLAKGPAFESLIAVMSGFASAMSALTPPSTPATNATFNTLGSNLTLALQALTDLVTTQLEGT